MNGRIHLKISLFVLSLFLVDNLSAQDGFDIKKKKRNPVNTSSLNATVIRGSSNAQAIGNRPLNNSSLAAMSARRKNVDGVAKVVYSEETGLPRFINSSPTLDPARLGMSRDINAACFEYMDNLKPVLKLNNNDVSFAVSSISGKTHDERHLRLNQYYKNVPVYGAEVIVHLDRNLNGKAFNGIYHNIDENIDVVPGIPVASALQCVDAELSRLGRHNHGLTKEQLKYVQYKEPKVTLVIYPDRSLVKTYVLAYHVISCPNIHDRWEYFIDAKTGKVLEHYNSTCFVDGPRTATAADLNGVSQSINTYQKGATYYLLDASRTMFNAIKSTLPDNPIGGILTIDLNNSFGESAAFSHVITSNNAWNITAMRKAVSAHANAGFAYNYFATNHSRNSINGTGGTIISIINVPDQDGTPLDNAYWNGEAIFYGNGNVAFKPLAGSLDVAGHEMTHGVVQNTANLNYEGQSGAINESMADIFGSMMDPADWLIGEDIVKTSAFPSGALRSMSDPHNGGTSLASPGYQPKHMNEAYTGSEDNGGVHINSGIPNHAFYKYAEAISRTKAAAVFYRALDVYLTKSSQFIDLRLAVIQSATDLYGASSNEVVQAGIAFDAVGISSGQGGNYNQTLPVNPGEELLLVYNTDGNDPNTLYRTNSAGTTITALSQTDFISRPSITDDGTVAVFVGSDNRIHAITTAVGQTPEEVIIQDEPIWSNVVISKRGTKIAAVTAEADATIYVYDFASEEWAAFELYNPTYTEGVTAAGALYADALEWDYSGETLVYDCFNSINNSNGLDIEYWDVNFIRVWDNDANTFGDGTVQKLFSSLPDGVSIGNPAFSKNSPNIIAFDYFDESQSIYIVLGSNVETGAVEVIADNNTLGWPSYNRTDSRVAFTYATDTGFGAGSVAINSDKISSSATATQLFTDAKWPIYYATGTRNTGEPVITSIPGEVSDARSLQCYPTVFSNDITIHADTELTDHTKIEIMNSVGQTVYVAAPSMSRNGKDLSLKLDGLNPGNYILRLSDKRSAGSCRVVKR